MFRSTNEVAGPKKVRVTEAIANLKQFSRKKTYIELDNYESEDDNETDLNNNTPSDSDTDGEDSETYSDADDFLYSGSKSSLRYGVDSNPLPPPAEPYPLEELRILKLTGSKSSTRHGVDSNPLSPPEKPRQLEDSKILRMNRQVRRHGYFECKKCKHNWECSYVYCNFDGLKNGKPIYKVGIF